MSGPLDFDSAFEVALRHRVLSLADARERELVPPLAATEQDRRRTSAHHAFALYNQQSRRVPPVPHAVHLSRQILANPLREKFADRLYDLIDRFKGGDASLNDQSQGFVSKMASGLYQRGRKGEVLVDERGLPRVFLDDMMFEWLVWHFHLATDLKSGKRGNWIVLVHVRPGNAYFVDIVPHKDGEDRSFDMTKYLDIIDEEWRGLLQFSPTITGTPLTPTQVKNLRRNHVGAMPLVSGKAFQAFGIRTFQGTPLDVRIWLDRSAWVLEQAQQQVLDPQTDEHREIREKIEDGIGGPPDEVHVDFVLDPFARPRFVYLGRQRKWARIELGTMWTSMKPPARPPI